MNFLYGFYKHKKYIVLIIPFFLIARLIFAFIFPYTNGDGPWYLDHAFSVMQGHFFEMSFSKEYMPFFNLPYMYGILNAVFYYPFLHTSLLPLSIFFWNTIWIGCFITGAYYVLKNTGSGFEKWFILSLAYIFSTYAYSLRCEVFILPFLILLLLGYRKLLQVKSLKLFFLNGFLISVIGLMHPIAGIYSIFFITLYTIDEKGGLNTLIKTVLLSLLWVIILYAPVIVYDFSAWKLNFIEQGLENQSRAISGEKIYKFFALSPVFLALSFFILSAYPVKTVRFWKEVVYWFVCLLLLGAFGRSFYLPYLFHFALWRLTKNNFEINFRFKKLLLAGSLLAGFFVSYFWQMFQISENPSFALRIRQDIQYVRNSQLNFDSKKIWISGNIAMSVIDNLNSRLHFNYYETLTKNRPLLDTSDVLFIDNYNDLSYIRHFQLQPGCKFSLKEIYSPVKGLITLDYPLKRSDSIGLWQINIVQN